MTTTTEPQQKHYTQSKPPSFSSSSRLAQLIYKTPPESDSPQPSQLTRTPSLLERVKSIKFSSIPTESEHITNSPSQLTRVPSFFDRVKSFKIPSPFTYEPPSTQPDHHVIRSKSENIAVIKKKSSLVSEMKKSRSEMRLDAEDDEDVDKRRPATTRERRNVVDEEVDAKADDFISRFKQQLKLQRLESLVRYNEKLNKRS
nr:BEACH domain-containing protein LvsA-like [Tanacetum cinerariifolium]